MNGGGKLWPDPSGSSDFMGRVGAQVHLAVLTRLGRITLASARYNEQPLEVEGEEDVRFVVGEGQTRLSLSLETNTKDQEVGVFQEIGSGGFALLTFLLLRTNSVVFEFKIQGVR
jgi:hypothetical protein